MVGVPGRSKGCHTCIKRRVKCDEQRPICGRCTKAGYHCQGYERKVEIREHTFVKFDNEHRMQVSKPPARIKATAPTVLLLNTAPNEPSDPAGTVPQSLSLVAFKDDMQFSFVIDNSVWRTYGWPWLEMSAQGKLGTLSLDACRCFAQTVFGKQYYQKDIEIQGLALYGQTIRTLSQKLTDIRAGPGAEDLIGPILLLLMHASTSEDRNASQAHVMGLIKVMQYCQPAVFAKTPLRLVFESSRSTLFTVSLVLKQRCFLDQPAWKSEPWVGLSKSPQNELIDILVNLPGYLKDLNQVERGYTSKEILITRLEADLVFLNQWRWNWQEQNPNAAWEVHPSELPPEIAACSSRVFPKVLWFATFTQSSEILLYNAVLICTLGLLSHFSPSTPFLQTTPLSTPLRSPGQHTSLYDAAVEIYRAFEHQLLSVSSSHEAAFFWLLPMGVASKVLQTEVRYGRWAEEMLGMAAKLRSHGSGSSEFAFGYWDFLDKALAR